ncbi:hypothetical protein [Dyadobacter sp. CY323]|uniref:hypothetical protein n=1 Tax=Dyadobacter sp. CY323 TaxID=2907302 RepID=UPI001F2F8FE1|nr:hypothetical protein [Dyadobacter sp. CY323]MCE6992218.1 hypothetical protein [Dyadobacter sp. CY323]
MNSQETDDQARATKKTGNVWKWILGVGVVLMLIAFWGGFFNHDGNFGESDNPSENSAAAISDSTASDTTMTTDPDTIMEHVRGTE